MFEIFAKPLEWIYSLTHNYILSIGFMALIVMVLTAPLVLKSTKGMLEMQRLQPEMRRLQQQYRGDRQTLNAEMMKLYQQHKVNPMASCFPLLLQMPVFFIMWKILHGLTNPNKEGQPFVPQYTGKSTELYRSLVNKTKMLEWGFDLARKPTEMIAKGLGEGWKYAALVVALGFLYYIQQKMIAARATVAPTMSATQQKIMQYLPVVFAVFLIFYLTGLVIYYALQAVIRIGLQYYITHRFYKGEHSLGRQALAAGEKAREMAKADKDGGGGFLANARRELAAQKDSAKKSGDAAADRVWSKRVTAPKNKPTNVQAARPPSSGRATRPGSRPQNKKK